MAGKTIHVDIVSAEGEIFSGEAEMVFVPATEGELGITPRHAPLLTLIKAGEVRVKTAEGDMDLHFPPSALQGIKEGDRVEVQLAIRPAGATGASTKAPGGAKSGDAAKPKTQ